MMMRSGTAIHEERADDRHLFNRQVELETEMQGLGTQRFWKRVQDARERELESSTAYGIALTKRAIDPLSRAIVGFLEKSKTVRGVKHIALRHLSTIDPDVVAFITIKSVLDSVTLRRPLQRAAVALASMIEDEARFRQFELADESAWKVVCKAMEDRRERGKAHKRRALIVNMNKRAETNPDLLWPAWGEIEKLHVGIKCIDLMMAATGLIRTVEVRRFRHRSMLYVEATEETMEWINKKNAHCELLTPMYLPTIIPPKPWRSPTGGGYHSGAVRPLPLVKTSNKNYLEELHNRAHEMEDVYTSVNGIQETAWRINVPLLSVMQQVWEQGLSIGDIPSRIDAPLPPKPPDIQTNRLSLKLWKIAASKVYQSNVRIRSRRLQAAKILWVAEKFLHEKSLYFPHNMDFRGRLYAIPSFLNPQGCDAAKSLLEFSQGKPLGEGGQRWLAIHGANMFGEDKCTLNERVQWVTNHQDAIQQCATDPLSHRWWTGADKPWQFLAFCIEWVQSSAIGPTYISHIPVSVDGACNGLQNFSAMLRDEVGGQAVNLVPSEIPQDIYQRVADVTRVKVESDAQMGVAYAREWLTWGFDRSATKRCVMVLPYGGTLFSSRSFVQDYMADRADRGNPSPWADTFKPAAYLAKHIWSSIREVVIAARTAMDWLQGVSRLAANESLPVSWVTPAGFPVLQSYPEMSSRRVMTKMGDSAVKLTLSEATDEIDRRRQAQGISPNFVHSMDAACLMLTVSRCSAEGVRNFAMVHDSFGTLAADMDTMSRCLREAFIDVYQTDVLESFRTSILAVLSGENAAQLPKTPPKGRLDINVVKESVYFFA